MVVRLLRASLVAAVMVGAALGASAVTGAPRWLTTAIVFAVVLALYGWLPRAAHRAFRHGRFGRAELLYRVLRAVLPFRAGRAAVDVSMAACALGRHAWEPALDRMDRIDDRALEDAPRAALLNNRGYALARAGRDPDAAVAASEGALALRPDVIGFRHTRGVTLIFAGRIDEAIRVLDDLWSELAAADAPLLEAERCYDLATAWLRKGERDYAVDYFERARLAAPGSYWSDLAARELAARSDARPARATSVNEQINELL